MDVMWSQFQSPLGPLGMVYSWHRLTSPSQGRAESIEHDGICVECSQGLTCPRGSTVQLLLDAWYRCFIPSIKADQVQIRPQVCPPNVRNALDFTQDGESELYGEVPMVEQGYHSTLAARYHGEVVHVFPFRGEMLWVSTPENSWSGFHPLTGSIIMYQLIF